MHLVSWSRRSAGFYISRKFLAMEKLDAPCMFQVTIFAVLWSFLPGRIFWLLGRARFFVASRSSLKSDAPDSVGILYGLESER